MRSIRYQPYAESLVLLENEAKYLHLLKSESLLLVKLKRGLIETDGYECVFLLSFASGYTKQRSAL